MIQETDLQAFKSRTIKANAIFAIREVDKHTCYEFVRRHHYLGNAKFFCVYGYGMYYRDKYGTEEMVGCATFSNPQGISSLKGWFGLSNSSLDILELSRLCVLPCLNHTNATSFLLGNALRLLKQHGIRAVITLADSSRHVGSIYQVCNFKYYGLTDKKTDFYTFDGYKNPRGATKDVRGVWVNRPQKHRYAYLLDKNINVLYPQQPYPPQDAQSATCCCNGTKKVYDNRFDEWYSCPVCCGYIRLYEKGANVYKIKNTEKYNDYGQQSLF